LSPRPAGTHAISMPRPRSHPARSRYGCSATGDDGAGPGGLRHEPQREPPSRRRLSSRPPSQAVPRPDGMSESPYRAGTPPTQMCRPGSRTGRGASAQGVEVSLPSCAPHGPGVLQAQCLQREVAESKVDGVALGAKTVAAHDDSTGFVVDVDVGPAHTPMVHTAGVANLSARFAPSETPRYPDQR